MEHIDDDVIVHPKKTKKDKTIPPVGLLFVNPGEAKRMIESTVNAGGSRCFLHNSSLALSPDNTRFIAGPAIGAPAAALAIEKLIVLGAHKIIMMGWCGAVDPELKIGDIVIPLRAVCGEGTSRYYTNDVVIKPGEKAVEILKFAVKKSGKFYKLGTLWSTDAPYRESRKYLQKLREKEDVVGVDMEFSALCSVAAFRQIEFGAIMIVSDELWGKSWQSGFKKGVFTRSCEAVEELLLQLEW